MTIRYIKTHLPDVMLYFDNGRVTGIVGFGRRTDHATYWIQNTGQDKLIKNLAKEIGYDYQIAPNNKYCIEVKADNLVEILQEKAVKKLPSLDDYF